MTDLKSRDVLSDWPTWPQYGVRELDAVSRVVRSQQLFAAGEVRAFEVDFANFQEAQFAVAMGNATQGLHLALAALNVGQGDEVIVTPCSWISSVSCVLMQNAVPVFVDIESESLGLDPSQVELAISSRTRAIILVHLLGYPAKVAEIREIADRHGIALIEDASHAPGAKASDRRLGTYGDIGVFSLHQRKAISTGDGGIICTDNSRLAEKIRRLRSFGDAELSYNYRMTEFAGALGRLGLERLDDDNAHRAWAANYLAKSLDSEDWVTVRLAREGEVGVYYAVALEINLSDGGATQLVDELGSLGLPIRQIFSPLNWHPHFADATPSRRGRPWREATYRGSMRGIQYPDLHLPVAYEYCQGRVLELYTHPGTSAQHLDAFATVLATKYRELVRTYGPRDSWTVKGCLTDKSN